MSITVYGRKSIRRFEREIGEKIVHASGEWVTTLDHRHFWWDGCAWQQLPLQPDSEYPCGVPYLSSCSLLFGRDENGHSTHFMRGACSGSCGAGPGRLHAWDCTHLRYLLEFRSINPDYYPRPVHRPMWMDDPRLPRHLKLGVGLGVPPELLYRQTDGFNHWHRSMATTS